MKYFVTVKGEVKKSNLTKEQAIKEAMNLYTDELGTLNIGIGKYKIRKGERVYTLIPMHFFTQTI